MSTLEMRRQRAALVQQAREILDAAKAENRDLNSEEQAKYDRIMGDVDAAKARIDREERVSGLESELSQSRAPERTDVQSRINGRTRSEVLASDEYRDAFMASLRHGLGGSLKPEQAQLLHELRDVTPQTVGTDATGGYLVPTTLRNQIVDAMKAFGGPRLVANVITTDGGGDIRIPTNNDTANVGELVAENVAVATQHVEFGIVTLEAYKFSSKTILCPYELLQDNAVNLESWLSGVAGTRLGRITNTYYTTGTGTSQPQGVVAASALGVTAASASALTYGELVDLEHSLEPSYRKGATFMMNDSTVKALKKLTDGYGRPLWLPGLALREPDTILGYPFVVNQDMASIQASAKAILFGDFKNFIIRDVMAIQMFRIVDKYIETAQVGFLAYMRSDSKLVNAGTNPLVHLIMHA